MQKLLCLRSIEHSNTSLLNIFTCTHIVIYLGFVLGFNTVQVMSQRIVMGRRNQDIQMVKVLYCKHANHW